MEFKIYDALPIEAKNIRIKVFVDEQGFKEEFDNIDNNAKHIVAFDKGIAVATCRFFSQDDYYLLGRIAVIKEYRRTGLGSKLLEFAKNQIKLLGGKEIRVHAQLKAKEFYQKQGYTPFGDIDYEELCEHIWMKRNI